MEAIKQKGRLKAALIRKGTVPVATFILHGNLQKIISIYIWHLDLFEISPAFAGNVKTGKKSAHRNTNLMSFCMSRA